MHITTQIKIYLFHILLYFVAPTCVCFQMIKCDNNQQTKEGTNKTKYTIHLLSKLCDQANILLTFLPNTSSQSASVLTGLTVTTFLLLFPILQCRAAPLNVPKYENFLLWCVFWQKIPSSLLRLTKVTLGLLLGFPPRFRAFLHCWLVCLFAQQPQSAIL